MLDDINNLKVQAAALKVQKCKVTRDLRNARRRKQRLRQNAKGLNDADLLTVLQMRAVEATAASSKAKDAGLASEPAAAASPPEMEPEDEE